MKIPENLRTSDNICWKHFGKTNCYILQFSCLKRGFHGILNINPDNTNYDKNSYTQIFFLHFSHISMRTDKSVITVDLLRMPFVD